MVKSLDNKTTKTSEITKFINLVLLKQIFFEQNLAGDLGIRRLLNLQN